MTSSFQSRLGTAPEEGVKAPCKARGNVDLTLSGEQTVNGTSVTAGDRVFVTAQTDGEENGIYIVQTGSWIRAPDWDGAGDVVNGMLVPVTAETRLYMVTCDASFTVGEDTFTVSHEISLGPVTYSTFAERWATHTGSTVKDPTDDDSDTGEYAAKEWAVGTTVPGKSAKEWASRVQIKGISTTTHTLTDADGGHILVFTHASGCTLTLPEQATEALTAGFECGLRQDGGTVTLATEDSDTLVNSLNQTTLGGDGALGYLYLETAGSPNTWVLSGDTSEAPEWGIITGTLSDQTDLQNALDAKMDAPASSASNPIPNDTWRTPNADRPTFLIFQGIAVTNGTTQGRIEIDVDESGGTTPDYDLIIIADPALGSNGQNSGLITTIIPAGGSYRLLIDGTGTSTDPAGLNTQSELREFTL